MGLCITSIPKIIMVDDVNPSINNMILAINYKLFEIETIYLE